MKAAIPLIFLTISVLLIAGCSSAKTGRRCCQQCVDAFGSSPVGVGEQAAQCGEFTTGSPLSEECGAFFMSEPRSVKACQDFMDEQKIFKQ